MFKIILLGLVGGLISLIISSIWYSPKLFGKIQDDYHAKRNPSFKEYKHKLKDIKDLINKKFLLQFLLFFITSFFLAIVMKGGYGLIITQYLYMFIGIIWISFTVPAIGSDILWSEVSGKIAFKKFLSDIFYSLVTFLFIAFIFSLAF